MAADHLNKKIDFYFCLSDVSIINQDPEIRYIFVYAEILHCCLKMFDFYFSVFERIQDPLIYKARHLNEEYYDQF